MPNVIVGAMVSLITLTDSASDVLPARSVWAMDTVFVPSPDDSVTKEL